MRKKREPGAICMSHIVPGPRIYFYSGLIDLYVCIPLYHWFQGNA